MMIITKITLSDFKLLIAANQVGHSAKLVLIDWLNDKQDEEDCNWQDSKSLAKIKTHHNLSDNDFKFINENSLSIENTLETLLLATIAQLHQYASGERQHFSIPLDIKMGTPFQQKVWQALMQIPYGETISYAALAQNIDQPNAFRAVASANGKNPFSIVIPCHRVISSDGGLGGYTGGLDKKRWLLQTEGKNNVI